MLLNEAVIYCRASKDKTGAGLSVAGQETDCRDLARRENLIVRQVYADNDITASGRKQRPGYRQMLADLATSPATVIVWHTDRLHRHMVELEEYIALAETHGIETRTFQAGELDLTTASGRMVARLMGAVDRHELEHMSERRRAGKARAAAAGAWRGGCRPFGWEADGVTLIPAEAAMISSAADAFLNGASLSSIARDWTASGVPTSGGQLPWSAREIRKVLRRPRNAGLMVHQGKILEGVRGCWAPVIEESVWRDVEERLTDPARRTTPGPAPRWLLSGIATCGVCGAGLVASTTSITNGKGRSRPVYRCKPPRASSPKGHLGRDCAALDAYVTEVVLERLRWPDATEAMRPAPPGDRTATLRVQIATARHRLDGAAGVYAAGEIDVRQLTTITAKLNGDIERANRELAALSKTTALAAFRDRDPEDVWDLLDLDRKRAVIRLLMSVTVHPAPRGRPAGWKPGESYFDPDYVEIGPPKT